MRQTAQRAIKAQIAKSGELDMNRLAKYQIVDDVFKRVTYLPEGKNHGVTVLIDWSGSISAEIKDILEQAMILAEFCRKVQIPFRIYLFSDAAPTSGDNYWRGEPKLIEIFSNEMSSRDFQFALTIVQLLYFNFMYRKYTWNVPKKVEEMIEEMSGLSLYDLEYNYMYDFGPSGYDLGGTPLDHSIIGLRKLLPIFNKKYMVEKSILTVIMMVSPTVAIRYLNQMLRRELKCQNKCQRVMMVGESKQDRYLIDPYSKKSISSRTKQRLL